MAISTVTHVVLTGGIGSRLWPLSRKTLPKQYLELFDGESLFEKTVARNQNVSNKMIVVGNIENYKMSNAIMSKFDKPFIHIVEALPRNTAAAIAFAAFASKPEDVLLITPSDHIIEGSSAYSTALQQAIDLANKDYLVTFGIKPTKPETGYGYIEFENENVIAFHEKPNLETAKTYLKRGNYFWNSGLFCFKAGKFLEELKKQEPEVYETSKVAWEANKDGFLDYNLSLKIPSISIDYAVMERSKDIKVVAANFEWSDLGSFESVYDYLVQKGHPIDTNRNIVIGTSMHTTFIGVKNCILIYTADALMVLQKENSQEVKQVYQQLESIASPLL
ncbi:mannose-1-phosphate guanylyltransferase [Flavobacterium hibernum]|uniref:Mannose-1-phosphate guanylyltransferase n=1 Tax=Flavobacterium hibernum TaxID=37752 RepID=A0A0D0EJU3_9FLAO|nr:mannose-1-phosphate guanylyltransferase [Flavobacterium hibernum]KIO51355.1 mannose-1-phosphate guanylyltransferase [Flavobacterium hibernum]OXA91015.1 mannose-1-phosphate guanylyltransferase [Flavobacterium hibernum]STO11162.1 Alginate biosynthesis protein AlgA [Flavobacterium hibernum]